MKKFLLFCCCAFSLSVKSQTVGFFYNYPGSLPGYLLFAPGRSDTTYLIDKCGKRIHEWGGFHDPGLSVYLLPDGTLLRCENLNNSQFTGGGQGGLIEKFDWNSNLLWSYQISDNTQCQHHDAIQLPNGNIVAIAWEDHTKADAQANGRVTLGTHMWSDKIVEIQPVGPDSGIIVWQWRAWDHLIQEADAAKLNYGVVADHPELLDINVGSLSNFDVDWLHFNGLDYDAEKDQLMVSCHEMSEVYILDHSTTIAEAASHEGGNSGHGGDLMYRWGNPQNYGRGTADDRKLYEQHNAQWIPQGYPGAGKVLVFNNGYGRPGTDYTTVETFQIPEMDGNNYPLEPDSAYEPDAQDWIYTANPANSFFSFVEGGAQRLINGNTLICEATSGNFFEVDSLGNELWRYVNPVGVNGPVQQGTNPFQNTCFRVTYLAPDYPGLAGQTLIPGGPIELNPLNYNCLTVATGIEEVVTPEKISIYPNPFKDQFVIHLDPEYLETTLEIYDLAGRLLYKQENLNTGNDLPITLQGYRGVILLSLKDVSGKRVWHSTAVAE
jgi:hypothetical protein